MSCASSILSRYDLALDAHVNGAYQLMMFAKKCKNLKLLMHYSTGMYWNKTYVLIYKLYTLIMEQDVTLLP